MICLGELEFIVALVMGAVMWEFAEWYLFTKL